MQRSFDVTIDVSDDVDIYNPANEKQKREDEVRDNGKRDLKDARL